MACSITMHGKLILIRSDSEINREDGEIFMFLSELDSELDPMHVCVYDFSSLKKIHALAIRPLVLSQDVMRKKDIQIAIYIGCMEVRDLLIQRGAIRRGEVYSSIKNLHNSIRGKGVAE